MVGHIKINWGYSAILVIVLGIISLFIVSSLFRSILAGLVLSYVFYPVYKMVYSRLKRKTVSALVVTLVVLLMLTMPTFLVVNKLSTEVSVFFITAKQYMEGGGNAANCSSDGLCKFVPTNLKDASPRVKAVLTNTLGKATDFILNATTQALLSLPNILLQLFIVFFIMYYALKDGASAAYKLKSGFPLKKHRQDALIAQFNDVASAVVYGTVIVAILQAVLAGIGFYLFGLPSPILWALVTLVVSLIPFLGPVFAWLPAAVLMIFSGYYSGEGIILLRGVGLFLYGTFIVSGLDNILKPRIIGRKAGVHPALVLIGILGGINLFGVVGFVVGPVIIAMLKTAFDTYVQERKAAEEASQQLPQQ